MSQRKRFDYVCAGIAAFLLIAYSAFGQTIDTTGDSIVVYASAYSLHIEKISAECAVTDGSGNFYASFPIWANAAPITDTTTYTFQWSINQNIISYNAVNDTGKQCVQCVISCYPNDFEVNFKVVFPDTNIFVRARQGFAEMMINWTYDNGPSFIIDGESFPTAIWTHAVSEIDIPLPRNAQTFVSYCGRDASENYQSNIQFAVSVDSVEKFLGPIMGLTTPAQHISVDVTGGNILKLYVYDGGDGIAHDHALWAAPYIVTSSGDSIDVTQWMNPRQQTMNYFTSSANYTNYGYYPAQMFNPSPDCEIDTTYGLEQMVVGGNNCGYYFNPPPSILSVFAPSTGSYMGLGLTSMPNSGFIYLYPSWLGMDVMWNKFPPHQPHWYTPPGICFIFAKDRYQTIKLYHDFLVSHNYIADIPLSQKNIPAWWDNFSICTWGEEDYDIYHLGATINQAWDSTYLYDAEQMFHDSTFTFIIDQEWQLHDGDPTINTSSFPDLKGFITSAHTRGHHVLLHMTIWPVADSTLATNMGISQSDVGNPFTIIDATNPEFPSYVDSTLRAILDTTGLNADGIKMDYVSCVRMPEVAQYANSSLGMGFQEQLYALQTWFSYAKRIKPDCIINCTVANPFYTDVADKLRMNDNSKPWYSLQQRAVIASLACPNNLLDSDGWLLNLADIEPYYFGACVFSTPSLLYLHHYADLPAPDSTIAMLQKLYAIYKFKRHGTPIFKESDGSWQCMNGDTITAESFDSNMVITIRCQGDSAKLLARTSMYVSLPLFAGKVTTILSDSGQAIPFIQSDSLYFFSVKRGIIYTLRLENDSSVPPPVVNPSQNLVIYPNPSTESFWAIAANAVKKYSVVDILGNVFPLPVMQHYSESSYTMAEFSTVSIPSGAYFLQCTMQDNSVQSKMFTVVH